MDKLVMFRPEPLCLSRRNPLPGLERERLPFARCDQGLCPHGLYSASEGWFGSQNKNLKKKLQQKNSKICFSKTVIPESYSTQNFFPTHNCLKSFLEQTKSTFFTKRGLICGMVKVAEFFRTVYFFN